MSETKTKSVPELQAQLTATINQQGVDGESLKSLRSERAKLAVENSQKNVGTIEALDKQIDKVRNRLDNSPSVIAELENQLAAENQRLAASNRSKLLEQQRLVADDIEHLSKQFIEILRKAKSTNELLRSGISAYNNLFSKTGQQVLSNNHCQGSEESLSRLFELQEHQFSGTHTSASGPGMVQSNRPIRL